jgi:transposase
MKWVMIDATIIRAHQHSSGAKEGRRIQTLGRSWGGSKIYVACDAHGNPLRFILTGGEVSDCRCALVLN